SQITLGRHLRDNSGDINRLAVWKAKGILTVQDVLAGLGPAIHVFSAAERRIKRRGCPAQGRARGNVRQFYALIVCNSSMLSPFCTFLTSSSGSKSMPTGFLSVALRLRM